MHTAHVEARVLKVTVTVQDRRSSNGPARGFVEVPWGAVPRIPDRVTSLQCSTLGYSMPGVTFPACVLCLSRQRNKKTQREPAITCVDQRQVREPPPAGGL